METLRRESYQALVLSPEQEMRTSQKTPGLPFGGFSSPMTPALPGQVCTQSTASALGFCCWIFRIFLKLILEDILGKPGENQVKVDPVIPHLRALSHP